MDPRALLPYYLHGSDWSHWFIFSIIGLDVSLSGTKRPRPPLATTTLFRVYTTFLIPPLQRRCFRTRMAIREPRCHITRSLALILPLPSTDRGLGVVLFNERCPLPVLAIYQPVACGAALLSRTGECMGGTSSPCPEVEGAKSLVRYIR